MTTSFKSGVLVVEHRQLVKQAFSQCFGSGCEEQVALDLVRDEPQALPEPLVCVFQENVEDAAPLGLVAPQRRTGSHADADIHSQPALAGLRRCAEEAEPIAHQALDEHRLLNQRVGHQILGGACCQWFYHFSPFASLTMTVHLPRTSWTSLTPKDSQRTASLSSSPKA